MRSGKLYLSKVVTPSQGWMLSLNQALPFPATLEQWSVNFTSLPVANEMWIIQKTNPLGSNWTVDLVMRPAMSWGGQIVVCNEKWEFAKGDVLSVFYANTEHIGITFQACFTERG